MEKTVVISGVTGSIGGAAARFIAQSGAKLFLLGRNIPRLSVFTHELEKETGNHNLHILAADLSSIESVKKAAAEIRNNTAAIDALVNVAAIYKKSPEVSMEGNELMFATNHLGAFTLTLELLETLKKSPEARIITVTASSTVRPDFSDLNSEKKFSPIMQFGMTKMCNLLFAFKLARLLEGTNISSSAFFPGLVKSGLMRELPWLAQKTFRLIASRPEKAGEALSRLVTGQNLGALNGKYYNRNLKSIIAPSYAYDRDAQDLLWAASAKLTGENGL